MLLPELEKALALPDPSIGERELTAARAKLTEARDAQAMASACAGSQFVFIDARALVDSEEEEPLLLPYQQLQRRHPVQMMIRVLLPKAETSSADAADALAVAICHAQHRGMRALVAQMRAG